MAIEGGKSEHPFINRFWSAGRRFALPCGWLYVAALFAFNAVLQYGGDRWWWATVLLFGPRWLALLPAAVVLPVVLLRRGRARWCVAGLTVVGAGLVLGFNVPVPRWFGPSPRGRQLRVLTCNIDGAKGGTERLADLIRRLGPDVVALEESSEACVRMFEDEGGWHVEHRRGLCLASRLPLAECEAMQDDGALGYWGAYALRCRIGTPADSLTVCVVHLETPREGIEAVLAHGWRGRAELENELQRRARISALARRFVDQAPGQVIVLGDFNCPVESTIYRHDWSDFANAFSRRGWGLGLTKLTRWFGLRIDHILASRSCRVARCWVSGDLGSDHRPLVADIDCRLLVEVEENP